jgi:hypothetical protein
MTAARAIRVGAALAGLTAGLIGCVTEGPARPRVAPPPPNRPAMPVRLPDGPVAAPVTAAAITNSRVRIAISPLGSVPYDGQVLPLVSPDGRFIAVQEGTAPTWPTLLAGDEASVPAGTRLAVYEVSPAPPGARSSSPPIQRVRHAQDVPSGLILGRAADAEGFLVEAPRSDGSRWIGKVAWASGRLAWLAQDGRVSAHGVLMAGGELLFTRRPVNSAVAELVVRSRGGAEDARSDPEGAFLYPIATTDPAAAYALIQVGSAIELVCLAVDRDPPISGPARFGPVLARSNVAVSTDPAVAYQIAAPTQNTGPLARLEGEPAPGEPPEPPVIYHPRLQRAAAFDKGTSQFTGLAARSIAAAYWSSPLERGFFCTTPEGVVFAPYTGPGEEGAEAIGRRLPDARVLGTPYVTRRTSSERWPLLMLGPSRQDPSRIQVAAVTIVREEPPADR